MSLFGDFEHHLPTSVGNYISNSWVMFNWDIYQPLYNKDMLKVEKTGLFHGNPGNHHPNHHRLQPHQTHGLLGGVYVTEVQ